MDMDMGIGLGVVGIGPRRPAEEEGLKFNARYVQNLPGEEKLIEVAGGSAAQVGLGLYFIFFVVLSAPSAPLIFITELTPLMKVYYGASFYTFHHEVLVKIWIGLHFMS